MSSYLYAKKGNLLRNQLSAKEKLTPKYILGKNMFIQYQIWSLNQKASNISAQMQ